MAQMKYGHVSAGQTARARNTRNLDTTLDKVALLRRVGVAWLAANCSEVMWQGATGAKLCSTVSGWSFEENKENAERPETGRRGIIA